MKIKRRTFLQISAIGGVGTVLGCSSDVDKILYPMVKAPDDIVTGKVIQYAATCRECPAGCGILVRTREGRALKIEGNPLHPINRGKVCMRGQAAVQGAYHPDRLRRPLLKENGRFREVGLEKALEIFKEKTQSAATQGPNRVRLLTQLPGESLLNLFHASAARWNSDAPIIFEPYACSALKEASKMLLGRETLPDYAIERSDCLISFGADFLETWLSPVSYARRFKAMHAYSDGKKGRFIHVSPHESLTAANADRWICCRPGSEPYVALWLVRELLETGRDGGLPKETAAWLKPAVSFYSRNVVSEKTGIDVPDLDVLLGALMASEKPLVLGAGAPDGKHLLPLDLSALLLNYVLDTALTRLDFEGGHRMAEAVGREGCIEFFNELQEGSTDVLILHRANPVYSFPGDDSIQKNLMDDRLFVVSLTDILDDTSQLADLVIPICHPLESWDEYSSRRGIVSLLQPTLKSPENVLQAGDVILRTAFEDDDRPVRDYKAFMVDHLSRRGLAGSERDWIEAVRGGGFFSGKQASPNISFPPVQLSDGAAGFVKTVLSPMESRELSSGDNATLLLLPVPSIRFFDGRSGYVPWMSEVPDPITSVAWQTPVLVHPDTLNRLGMAHEDLIRLESEWGAVEAIVYETEGVHPGAVVMWMGQGHQGGGRYADEKGVNPLALLPAAKQPEDIFGMPVTVAKLKTGTTLAHTDGSRIQHGRKIALSVSLDRLAEPEKHIGEPHAEGLGMNDFPLTLPLPEGYDPARDIYPPHDHVDYRWVMAVDLDRCIGCGACAVACYAENNLGIVGERQTIEGREMAWMRVERYHDMADAKRITFLPMMCQHCDNAPCESVCPVYAPHHSKEGLNNQVYNRCIGTRFCSQNCPYKVRRFNWFDWEWPEPLNRQLNPDVTVRAKGVMEKCSFCVQRIKEAHGIAKNENRKIRDGEVIPACVQTCPTDALTFGNLMDMTSRVWNLVHDPRAYQVMGYLNTKPAVIYLRKVLWEA